jgi:hypothetical protein
MNNKNQYVMAFLSMLMARKVFQEIQMGHIHEDIDMHFNHLSQQLRLTYTFVLANLMKIFMESQLLSLFQTSFRMLLITYLLLKIMLRSL